MFSDMFLANRSGKSIFPLLPTGNICAKTKSLSWDTTKVTNLHTLTFRMLTNVNWVLFAKNMEFWAFFVFWKFLLYWSILSVLLGINWLEFQVTLTRGFQKSSDSVWFLCQCVLRGFSTTKINLTIEVFLNSFFFSSIWSPLCWISIKKTHRLCMKERWSHSIVFDGLAKN